WVYGKPISVGPKPSDADRKNEQINNIKQHKYHGHALRPASLPAFYTSSNPPDTKNDQPNVRTDDSKEHPDRGCVPPHEVNLVPYEQMLCVEFAGVQPI